MWTRLLLACVLLGLVAATAAVPPPPTVLPSPATQPAPPPAAAPPAAVVSLVGEVDDYTRDLLIRQFAQARRAGAKTVIVHLDTFGGLVTSGLDISRFLRGQSDLHTVAYVDKAISAGAMVAVACDEIVMAPSAVIGDCAPIVFKTDGALEAMPAAERAKAQSPIVNDFDASADRNHHDRLLLESMVVVERVVYWVEKGVERRFVDEKTYDKLTAQGWHDVPGVPVPVDASDTLLTVQTEEAVKLGLASGVAASPEALAASRGQAVVADLSPGAGEAVVMFLNQPFVRSLSFIVLMLSLWTVFSAPGHGLAEACAVLSLGVLVGVPLLTGYATWWEVVLILTGLGLLAFEVFVFPGHGVSAAVGLVLLLGGLLLTFVGGDGTGPSLLPHTPQGWAGLRRGGEVIAGGLVGSLVIGTVLRSYLPRLPYLNRLILTTVSGNDPPLRHSAEVPPDNAWPGVGTTGVATTDLRPGGSAEFLDHATGDNRTVAVVSEAGYVTAGATLVVREAKGNRIVVRPVAVKV